MKKFWYRCKNRKTGEEKEIATIAKNQEKAEKLFEGQDEWIPLEYTGWTEIKEEK